MRIDFDISNTNYIRISDSCSLRFVRTDTQSGYIQNKDDYNVYDLDYSNVVNKFESYFQRHNIGTDIYNQFALMVDYDDIATVELYNLDDALIDDLTADLTIVKTLEVNTYGNITWYDHLIDTALLGGYYYLLITTDLGNTYKSNNFRIETIPNNEVVFIEYYNDSDSVFDDGIQYIGSDIPNFYIQGNILDNEPGGEVQVYDSFDYVPEMLGGIPIKFDVLKYGGVQWFMVEKLNFALKHDYFFVNGKRYITDNNIDNEQIENTYINRGSIKLKPYNYASPIVLTEVTEPSGTIIGVGDNVIGVDPDILGVD